MLLFVALTNNRSTNTPQYIAYDIAKKQINTAKGAITRAFDEYTKANETISIQYLIEQTFKAANIIAVKHDCDVMILNPKRQEESS